MRGVSASSGHQQDKVNVQKIPTLRHAKPVPLSGGDQAKLLETRERPAAGLEARVKVFVVAEFAPHRFGLVHALAAESDLTVVGETSSLGCAELSVDFDAVDVWVVDLLGIEPVIVLSRLREWLPRRKVVFLVGGLTTGVIKLDAVRLFMLAECFGCATTESGINELKDVIRMVSAGNLVCDMGLIKPVFTRLGQWTESDDLDQRTATLSDREGDVLAMVARGMTNRQIADQLCLSEGTVKAHISHIMAKLGHQSRAALMRYGLAQDLDTEFQLETGH